MLLNDIAQNRYRIQSILKRLADAEGEEAFILQQLAREELLSEEQRSELAEAKRRFVFFTSSGSAKTGTQIPTSQVKRSGEEFTGFGRKAY